MKYLVMILLGFSLLASELTFVMESSDSDDRLARSDTEMRVFNIDLEYDLSKKVFGILGYSIGDGSADYFTSNRYGTQINSSPQSFQAVRIGIGIRF